MKLRLQYSKAINKKNRRSSRYRWKELYEIDGTDCCNARVSGVYTDLSKRRSESHFGEHKSDEDERFQEIIINMTSG